jgi:hypothetical protein
MTYIRTGGFLRHCHHRSWLGWFGHGRLAHSGLTVLICEQAPQVGGYFRGKTTRVAGFISIRSRDLGQTFP